MGDINSHLEMLAMKHRDLDDQIHRIQAHGSVINQFALRELKKRKLSLKDEMERIQRAQVRKIQH